MAREVPISAVRRIDVMGWKKGRTNAEASRRSPRPLVPSERGKEGRKEASDVIEPSLCSAPFPTRPTAHIDMGSELEKAKLLSMT